MPELARNLLLALELIDLDDCSMAELLSRSPHVLFAFAVSFRGKCNVKKLSEVTDSLSEYLEKDHSFFYNFGYKPESRYTMGWRYILKCEFSWIGLNQCISKLIELTD